MEKNINKIQLVDLIMECCTQAREIVVREYIPK